LSKEWVSILLAREIMKSLANTEVLGP